MNYNNTYIDWGKVDEVISSANKIFLTTHENPDGDGLGSDTVQEYCTDTVPNYWVWMYTILELLHLR